MGVGHHSLQKIEITLFCCSFHIHPAMMTIHRFMLFESMRQCQSCRIWFSFVERLFWRVFVLENLKQYENVPSTCQPRYNCGLVQGWSCSPNGIWLRIVLSQGLGWWRVFAGRQTFGFCLREHLKLGGTLSLAWSVHTLFFLELFSPLLCPVSFHVCILYEQLWWV